MSNFFYFFHIFHYLNFVDEIVKLLAVLEKKSQNEIENKNEGEVPILLG
jgi:hypothetical protein